MQPAASNHLLPTISAGGLQSPPAAASRDENVLCRGQAAMKKIIVLTPLGLFLAGHGIVTAITIYPQFSYRRRLRASYC